MTCLLVRAWAGFKYPARSVVTKGGGWWSWCCLGGRHPVLGPDVCSAPPGLIISCLLSPLDGVGDPREPCLGGWGGAVQPTPAEGLQSTQCWRNYGGCGRGQGPHACH